MNLAKAAKRYFSQNRRWLLVASSIIIIAAALLAVTGYLKSTIVLIVLFLVAVLPTIYQRWLRASIGIEFMVFSTVIAGFAYGPGTGFVFGAVSLFAKDVMNRTIGEWTMLNMVAMGVAGFIAGYFSSLGLVLVGVLATVVSEILRQIPTFLIGDIQIRIKNIAIASIHVAFNLWLFVTVSPIIQGLL
ncbi:hypothetical protein HYU11_06560 [Candidatus Woesearchaeota archaeon]|nr:hypothetical protein [Candidatus Woesearchaeota archaeon]